jgi:hypothetical protein
LKGREVAGVWLYALLHLLEMQHTDTVCQPNRWLAPSAGVLHSPQLYVMSNTENAVVKLHGSSDQIKSSCWLEKCTSTPKRPTVYDRCSQVLLMPIPAHSPYLIGVPKQPALDTSKEGSHAA